MGMPQSGAEIVLECLIRHGVEVVFAYPGGATLPIHQALTRVEDRLRTILPRHEQGGGFAASGYARSGGKVGVCFATSGPGATNLVGCLADAQRNAVPMVAITGQVNRPVLGTDAFQEIPIVSVCRSITKHHYLVTRVEDIPRVMKEALHIATTGRPGPVLVDVPKDLQARKTVANYDVFLDLPGYRPEPWDQPADEPTEFAASHSDEAAEEVIRRLWQLVRERRQVNQTILTTGFGTARQWVARGYRLLGRSNWVQSGSLGAIGYALSAALGVQAANPDKTVIAVDDPTSFLTHVQELACAYVEELPVKVLLIHPERNAEEAHFDFAELARGFRVGARSLNAADDVDEALEQLLDAQEPFVLDVRLPTYPLLHGRRASRALGTASV